MASKPGDYWVGVTIGEGSFGRVVHAKHKASGKDVAIKVLDKISLHKKPHLMRSVWMEKELLSQWESEHVVPLYAAFHDQECLYMVMACSKGGDLKHVIDCGRREMEKWRPAIPYYALQIVAALEFIHSKGVIHADLKPENVLMSESGKVQLADFGSAIYLQDRKPVQMFGTVDYASPEVLRNESNLTLGVDLWSLGCIVYAMWKGHSPFHSSSDALATQNIMKHESGCYELNPLGVHEAWMNLISALLTPSPKYRLGNTCCDSHDSFHSPIRNHVVWNLTDRADDAPYLAPMPAWFQQAMTRDGEPDSLRDGNDGWSAFLL